MPQVTCQNCGGRVDVPAGYAKAKVRCPGCGYYADVPPDARGPTAPPPTPAPLPARPAVARPTVARPAAPDTKAPPTPAVRVTQAWDPRDTRPRFEADEPHGPPLLPGTQTEDDDQPYAVPGTGLKRCTHCHGELPLAATFCVHCGRDLSTGKRASDREFEPIRRTWDEDYPLPTRLLVFGAVLAVDFLIALVGVLFQGWGVSGVLGMGVNVAMQAFILGTFEQLTVERTARGKASLTAVRRVGFLPFPPAKIKWQKSHAVGLVGNHETGVVAWAFFAYLLFMGVLPGLAFYWFYIHSERCDVVVCDVHGSTDARVFRARTRAAAADVAEVVATATGLWYKPVL